MEETKLAVDRARNGRGPTLIEAKTYRYSGHSKSDKQVYRTDEEVTERKEFDPILRLEKKMIKSCMVNNQELQEIKYKKNQQEEAAKQFELKNTKPELNDLIAD